MDTKISTFSREAGVRVILVNPPIRLPRHFAHYPLFSTLGLLTNAAWLRSTGRDVYVVDAFTLSPGLNIRDDGEGFRHIGVEVDDLVSATRERASDGDGPVCVIVSVTMFSDMNRFHENLVPQTAMALARALPEATIGLADLYTSGMNYFPYDVAEVMKQLREVEFILCGEAEATLPTVLDRLESESTLDLPRVAFRDKRGDVHIDRSSPEPFENLDALPLPAFDLLDMEHYFSVLADAIEKDLVHEYHVVERQLPLMTSRSCPYRCRFCTNQVLGLPWRAHSTEYVRRAVRELRERYAPDRLLLLDDNINVDSDRFRSLVNMLAEEGMAWDAVNGFRADRLDREMVRAIKTAGNTKITVSAESGDAELLRKHIKKGLKLNSVIKLARICDDEGIPLQVHYIVGVPGETKAQINKTLEFATELFERYGAWPLLQHAIPFPGTQMYRDCDEAGWFVAPPETISGAVLEVESIIRTPEFGPEEVIAMKHNAQHVHAAEKALTYLEIGGRCDCDCFSCHCRSTSRPDESPDVVELEVLTKQIERARFLGSRELLIGGGEPLLRRDLEAIIREATSRGFERVRLVTNAHGLANAERATSLFDAGANGFIVDLHGPNAKIHDDVARTQGAFTLTMAGLRQARLLGCSDLEATTPITRVNLESLPAVARLASALGFGHVHLVLPPPDSPAAKDGQIPTWDEARPWLLKTLVTGPPRSVDIQGAPLCIMADQPGAQVPSPPWILRRARAFRAKHDLCVSCPALIICGGFFRPEYESLYGIDPSLSSRSM